LLLTSSNLQIKKKAIMAPIAKKARGEKKKKGARRGQPDMLAAWIANPNDPKLRKCEVCPYVSSGADHGCKAINHKIPRTKEQHDASDTYEVVETRCMKLFLSGMFKPLMREFCVNWFNYRVVQQHCTILITCLAFNLWILTRLGAMGLSMDNVAEFVLRKKSPKNKALGILEIDSAAIKMVFSLCSKENKISAANTRPIVTFIRELEARGEYAHLFECCGDTHQLSGTSLQYARTQLMTNFGVMVDSFLWSKTQAWVNQEMIDIQFGAETTASPGAKLVRQRADVRKSVKKWLSDHVASKQ